MAFRIFIIAIVLICAYLVFETGRFVLLQNSLLKIDAEYVMGNAEGDITLVKFLDYNCSFCRDAHPIVSEAVRRDGNIAFIPRPVSILEHEGINPALLPFAAAKQGQGNFQAMHEALIANYRVIDEQVIQDLALELGLDHEKLKEDIESKDVLKAADKNLKLFLRYRLNGTPAYAVGKDILFIPKGTMNADDFLSVFAEARGR